MYKAVVVDDYEEVCDFIVEALRARDFDVRGYNEAEPLLNSAYDNVPLAAQPDLAVVDLQLQPGRMQGLDLVAELADRNVPSEILVISGNLGGKEMADAIMAGAGAALPKPLDFRDAIRKMEALADTGRKRRLYKLAGRSQELDSNRSERPVFLSYSSKDKRLANGLRRNLEFRNIPVWYAPITLEGGEIWIKGVQEGVKRASILVALVTDSYLKSARCFGELIGFQSRIESGHEPGLLILPLFCVPPEEVTKDQNFGPMLRDYHGINFSTRSLADALTVILGRIQNRLAQRSVEEVNSKGSSPVGIAVPYIPDKIA
jgi:DNA-binding response OmpR family regulator